MTDFVCHTAPLENAISILQCGLLLSAVNARKLPDTVLQKEDRNAANDPLDYFHYAYYQILEEKKKGKTTID